MRRYLCAALIAVLTLQSSGTSLAAPRASTSAVPLLAELRMAFAQAYEAFASTHIGAFTMGRESQFEAMHAPAPVIPHTDNAAHLTPEKMRATLALYHEHVFPIGGIHVAGPPMQQRPTPDQVRQMLQATSQNAAAPARAGHALAFVTPRPQLQFPRTPVAWHPVMRPTITAPNARRKAVVQTAVVQTSSASTTGVNRYWEYEEGAIPGVGRYMVWSSPRIWVQMELWSLRQIAS